MNKQESFRTPKGTELPLIDYKGKPYLAVVHRVIWFREDHPDWPIITNVSKRDDLVVGEAYIKNDDRTISMAHKTKSFKETDAFAKAETGAIGRALGFLGYGTEFAVQDMEEGDDVVDKQASGASRNSLEDGTGNISISNGGDKSERLAKIPNAADELKTVTTNMLKILGERSGKSSQELNALIKHKFEKSWKDLTMAEYNELAVLVGGV